MDCFVQLLMMRCFITKLVILVNVIQTDELHWMMVFHAAHYQLVKCYEHSVWWSQCWGDAPQVERVDEC